MKTPRDSSPPNDTQSEEALEAAEARRVILARRARYVALAMAATGVAVHACGGDMDSERDNQGGGEAGVAGMGMCLQPPSGGYDSGGLGPCLSIAPGGSAGMVPCLQPPMGGMRVCLGAGGSVGWGGMRVCLQAPMGGAMGGMMPYPGGSGGMTPCLDIAIAGELDQGGMTMCLQPPLAGEAGSAGSQQASAAGSAGMNICLSIPFRQEPPGESSAGECSSESGQSPRTPGQPS